MTMGLYGHLIHQNLWDAAKKVTEHTGGPSGASNRTAAEITKPPGEETAL